MSCGEYSSRYSVSKKISDDKLKRFLAYIFVNCHDPAQSPSLAGLGSLTKCRRPHTSLRKVSENNHQGPQLVPRIAIYPYITSTNCTTVPEAHCPATCSSSTARTSSPCTTHAHPPPTSLLPRTQTQGSATFYRSPWQDPGQCYGLVPDTSSTRTLANVQGLYMYVGLPESQHIQQT